jgi:hypothetical protein
MGGEYPDTQQKANAKFSDYHPHIGQIFPKLSPFLTRAKKTIVLRINHPLYFAPDRLVAPIFQGVFPTPLTRIFHESPAESAAESVSPARPRGGGAASRREGTTMRSAEQLALSLVLRGRLHSIPLPFTRRTILATSNPPSKEVLEQSSQVGCAKLGAAHRSSGTGEVNCGGLR